MVFDPGYWDDDFEARYRAAMMGGQPGPLEVMATEYPLAPVAPIQPPPPPPPPPPEEKRLAAPGVPVKDEVPLGALPLPPPMPEPVHELAAPPIAPASAEAPVQAPVSPPFAVDAISGGMVPGQEQFGAHQTAGKPVTPDEYLTNEEYGAKLSTLPLEQQEMIRGKVEGAKQNFQASRLLEESEKTRKHAELNAQAYQDSLKAANQRAAELDLEAKRIAAENPLDRLSWGRKLAGVLGAIMGGFAANKTGRNMGLEAVERIANEAAQQQTQQLALNARQQAAIGDQVGRSADMYKAAESVRLATFDKAIGSLEAEVQNFDPRGTTALRVMDQLNQIKARRAELLAKYQTEQQKAIEGALKEQREAMQLAETQRHNIAGEKADATRAYADILRAKTEAKKATAEVEVLPPEYYEAQGLPKPTFAMSKKDYGAWLENRGKAQTQENQSLATTNEVPGITIKDPKTGAERPFIAKGSPENVEKLRTRTSKIREIVSLIDDARRTRTGWSSDVGNSQEKQELDAIWGKAKLAAKDAFELGQITASDEALIKGALGTDNPSKLRNPLPGMEKARSLLVRGARIDLEAHGYPKGQWDIPDVQKSAAVATTEDKQLEFVLGVRNIPEEGESSGTYRAAATPQQINLINVWGGALASAQDDATRKHYADLLGSVAQKAQVKSLRNVARQALLRASTPTAPAEEVEPEASGVAHETLPEAQ